MSKLFHWPVKVSAQMKTKKMDCDKYARARERMAKLSIPELIKLLSSDSLRTRFLSEICLRDATST